MSVPERVRGSVHMRICVPDLAGGGGAVHKRGRRSGRVLQLRAFVYRGVLNTAHRRRPSGERSCRGAREMEALCSLLARNTRCNGNILLMLGGINSWRCSEQSAAGPVLHNVLIHRPCAGMRGRTADKVNRVRTSTPVTCIQRRHSLTLRPDPRSQQSTGSG